MQAEALAGRWKGRRKHSAASTTGVQLGRAILGYTAVITAVITLAPFRFAAAPVHGLSGVWTLSDIILNIVMFVPLGFLHELTRPPASAEPVDRDASWLRAFVLGALLSATIEIAQLFEAERFSSLIDIATNATGALVGSVLHGVVARRVRAESAVRSLALELPLMGLLYLLAPLVWFAGLAGGEGARPWLILPIAVISTWNVGVGSVVAQKAGDSTGSVISAAPSGASVPFQV